MQQKGLDFGSGMGTLWTAGYGGRSVTEFVTLLKETDASLVLDIRYMGFTRKIGFSSGQLGKTVRRAGLGFKHCQALGNVNYKSDTEPALLADEPAGLALLESYLKQGDVVIFCACRGFKRCHRLMVVDAMRARHPSLTIRHK